MTKSTGEKSIRFGVFHANLVARELRKRGIKVRLSGQPFTILQMLLEKPGEVVTREELQKKIWPSDTFVDFEQGLNSAIKKLRDALGDSAETPRYVETLPRIGYRFLLPVEADDWKPAAPEVSSQPVEPKPTSAPPAPTKFRKLSAVIAISIVVLAAVAVVLGVRTSRSSALLRDKDVIVIGPFDNFTAEPLFDETLRRGLIVGLEQSPFVQVLAEHRTSELLRQMGRKPDEPLTSKTSLELCQRIGSKVMAQGAIRSIGTSYVVELLVLRCDDGESVAEEQVVGGRKEDVLDALRQATARIRAKLGESLPSIAKYNAPLEQATTPSLEALKAYGIGAERWDAEGDRVAAPYFERAIELDPDFAMALGALAAISENNGEHELAKVYATKAYEHRDRATGIEKLLIESWYDIYVVGDLERAAQLYEIGLRDYPGNTRALNDFGVIEATLGNYKRGADLFREALRLDPSSATTYGNLAVCYMALEQPDQAAAILDEADRRQLPFEYLLEVRYWLAFARKDDEMMARVLARSEEFPVERAVVMAEQSQTDSYHGALKHSLQESDAASAIMTRDGDKETAATILAQAAVGEAEFGDSRKAIELSARALKLAHGQDAMVLAAIALARSGELAQAGNLAAKLNSAYPAHTQVQKYWLPLIRAQIELRAGKLANALTALEPVGPYELAAPSALAVTTLYPAYLRGEILLQKGETARAAAEFQKIAEHPGMTLNSPLAPLARLGLARAQAAQKHTAEARQAYADLLKIWQSADTDFEPLRQAKTELANLPAN